MPAAISATERYGPPSIVTTGMHTSTPAASPERRREFENILSHALPRFRRIAMRWLGNHEDAEDAVQDAMLSAFRHIADFDGRAQMSTWLTAIVINAVRMQIRRRPRGQMLPLDWFAQDGQWTASELLVDSRPTPEKTLEQSELLDLVIKLTRCLPPSQRAALLLRRQDVSIKIAAETMGVAEGTLKAQLARGRAKLAERFHRAIGNPKIEASGSDSKTKRKASSSSHRRNRTQTTVHLPSPAVLNAQGGCEAWVGA
jgi:RNA polymerase sigma-70 factor, ECF subfamily